MGNPEIPRNRPASEQIEGGLPDKPSKLIEGGLPDRPERQLEEGLITDSSKQLKEGLITDPSRQIEGGQTKKEVIDLELIRLKEGVIKSYEKEKNETALKLIKEFCGDDKYGEEGKKIVEEVLDKKLKSSQVKGELKRCSEEDITKIVDKIAEKIVGEIAILKRKYVRKIDYINELNDRLKKRQAPPEN